MIRRIQALNYRCLRYVDVHLDSFHILVGPNASGKSTLLDVIGFLGDLVRDGLMEAMEKRTQNFQDLVWNRPKRDMGFELALEFDFPPDFGEAPTAQIDCQRLRYEVCIREDDESFRIDYERAMLIPKPSRRPGRQGVSYFPESVVPPKTILGRGGKGVFPVFLRSGNKVKIILEDTREAPRSQAWQIRRELGRHKSVLEYLPLLLDLREMPLFGEGFWAFLYVKEEIFNGVKPLFLDSQKIRQPSPPRFRRSKFSSDGWNLPWLVMQLQQEHQADFAEWLSHVQTMLTDLEGVRIVEREDDRRAYLMLRYKTGVEVPSWMVSDGTLRFLAITLIPYLPHADQIYLLEEPENGIHPLALDAIYDSLSSAYDSQVFVATHSPAFLKLAEPREVLCFAKDEQGATDIIRGDRHPILRDWRGSVDMNALFATGVMS